MSVTSVMVGNAERHLGDHAAEIGNESTENRSFVHPAKHSFGIAGRRQHLHEESIGPLIITDVIVDQINITAGRPHGEGVDFQLMPVRQREHFRSEEHTSELQSLMRISYAVFCLKQKRNKQTNKE